MINTEYHFPGHQQALIKNNVCVAVLVFPLHNNYEMENVFANFEYDNVINLCEYKNDAILGGSWNGEIFIEKPHDSWLIGNDLNWHAPIDKPGENYIWNEDSGTWIEHIKETN
jgi:hypothetical protein